MNLSNLKTGCVVQGNYRKGCDEVVGMMSKHFTHVVFSTWEDPTAHGIVMPQNVLVLINERPTSSGLSNRNFQRASSINGIRLLKSIGCSYIMKWRSDMLPTNLNVSDLITQSASDLSPLGSGKLLTTTTRVRSVDSDWFSSISDFYHFGPTNLMELLWDDHGMDLSKAFNPPPAMMEELGAAWINNMDPAGAYFCAEQELYAWLKYRLLKRGIKSDHRNLMRDLFLPLDNLNICWYGAHFNLSPLSIYFRPTRPGMLHQWWRPLDWTSKKKGGPIFQRNTIDVDSPKTYLVRFILLVPLLAQILRQYFYFLSYKLKNA